MTIEWKRHAVAALAIAALTVTVSPVRADVLSEMGRFWQGAAVNTTGPTAFHGQASGHGRSATSICARRYAPSRSQR